MSLFSRERRANQGIVAVEFALIAPVFLYLLMGILEVSIMFLATTVVDGATYAAARKIRTGEAQLSGDATTTFQTELCAELVGVYNCDDITLDVRTFSSFSTVTIPDIKINGDGDLVFDDGDDDDTNDVLYVTEFTTGGSGDIVVARVIYSWEFATPFIGVLFADNGTAKFLSTTAVFRSEPYN
ncbi:MAG: pilus assembly protein [Rhodospirillales bacterium]|nr:pilus assembly protein [Rhodospirillales bacterium]